MNSVKSSERMKSMIDADKKEQAIIHYLQIKKLENNFLYYGSKSIKKRQNTVNISENGKSISKK